MESTTQGYSNYSGTADNNPLSQMKERGVTAPLEGGLAQEPVNSTIRTLLLIGMGGSIVASLFMQMQGRKNEALFVGQWAPTLATMALWYQVVKSRSYYSGVNEGR